MTDNNLINIINECSLIFKATVSALEKEHDDMKIREIAIIETGNEVTRRLIALPASKLNGFVNFLLKEKYNDLRNFYVILGRAIELHKRKMPFLKKKQLPGFALQSLGIPSICGKIDRISYVKRFILWIVSGAYENKFNPDDLPAGITNLLVFAQQRQVNFDGTLVGAEPKRVRFSDEENIRFIKTESPSPTPDVDTQSTLPFDF